MNGMDERRPSGSNRYSIGFLVLCVLLAAVSFAQEQEQEKKKTIFYQWTDRKGVVHVTDDPSKIPAKYYSSTVKIERDESEGARSAPAQQQEQVSQPQPSPSSQTAEDPARAHWRTRMREAKARLADAEKRYHDLERRRDEIRQNWGGPSAGRAMAEYEAREQASRLEEQMKSVQDEVTEARNEVENVIPDEARRAGVPPGWLRE